MDRFTGTRPVAEQHRFDVGALQAWLQRHVPGFTGPLDVAQFRGGQSNPTFKLITRGATYVMRSKPGPAARLLPSAHAIEREYRVMAALAARLARQLLLLARSYGVEHGAEIRIGLALAQEDLAQLLGASRQRVNQELKGFERQGALRVEPTRLVVLSREKLLGLSEQV